MKGLRSLQVTLCIMSGLCLSTIATPAQANETLEPDPRPLDFAILRDIEDQNYPVDCPTEVNELPSETVLTSEIICQEGLTPPSLWLTRQLFQSMAPIYNKLVTNWLTYLPQDSEPGIVDLIVDLQRWSLMDYFARYEFINTFGSSAYSFGYNTRVFNLRGELIGAYTCNFANGQPMTEFARCSIQLESAGLRSPTNSSF